MPSAPSSDDAALLSRQSRYVSACPVGCGAELEPTTIVLPEGALLACTECGQLVSQTSAARYWDTMRAFDELGYNQPAGRELERRIRVAERRLRRIAELLHKDPRGIMLVDVGCSRGQFLSAAVGLGFQAEGVEPAARIVAAARRAGLRVHEGLLEDVRFQSASFDAVSVFEVIEHLKEPISLMRECRRILKPGGVMCLTTGNARSWTVAAMDARWDYFRMEKDGGHISFFNPRSLALLARRAGLEVVSIKTARVRFTERGETQPALHAIGKLAAELLNVPARLVHRGHDMIAYLRRP